MEVSEDVMAVAKLRQYVETCDLNNLERAKTICRAFLNKYDTPQQVKLSEPTNPEGVFPTILPVRDTGHRFSIAEGTNLRIFEVHKVGISTKMDHAFRSMQIGHGEAKQQMLADAINRLSVELYNEGYVKVEHMHNAATFTDEYRVSVNACKESK